MIFAGIDYSITCPAVTIYDNTAGQYCPDNVYFYFNQNGTSLKEQKRRLDIDFNCSEQKKYSNDTDRFFALADWVLSIIKEHHVDVVAIEGYAMGSNGKVFNIAEATGILKQLLSLIKVPLYVYPPTTAKKWFCGKGNADKNLMIDTFNSKYDCNIWSEFGYVEKDKAKTPISDIVDSFAILYTHLQNNG